MSSNRYLDDLKLDVPSNLQFDESLICLDFHPNRNLISVGNVEGNVKMYNNKIKISYNNKIDINMTLVIKIPLNLNINIMILHVDLRYFQQMVKV